MKLDQNDARNADNRSSVITEAGKFEGEITRAEKLLSNNGAEGLGISFKSNSGATANYLDLYTANATGDKLPSSSIVNAILCCTRLRDVPDGEIEVEKWDKEAKVNYKTKVPGYPLLMGKKIGFLFQKELSTNTKTGEDVERIVIYGVFEAGAEFTASEILDKATKPEKLAKMVEYIAANPVKDRRKFKPQQQKTYQQTNGGFDNIHDDDLDF